MMREFATPLAERQRIAAYYRERYKRDPEYRLRSLNRSRVGQGLVPRGSVDEITSWSEGGRIVAARNRRDDGGRFT
jgi:hypothetical protein